MLNRNGNKLAIFEDFVVDTNLPKYTKGTPVELQGSIPVTSGSVFISTGSATTINTWGTIQVAPSNDGWVGMDSGSGSYSESKPKGFIGGLLAKFAKKKEEKRKTMTIISFFSSLAQSLNDLKTLQDIAIHYETAISNAAKAGQTALVDTLKSRLESAKSEVQLVINNLNKYLTEDQIVDFYKQAKKDKNLKLTWIKHFIKPIPSRILDAKADLDKQLVFDNYVVLHYDPNNDATDYTADEKEEIKRREKDPILFGVIKNSRRLYYIGDWIDDYCDLTLDVVIETLGEKVNEVNNDKVKTYLDLGERKEVREKKPNPYASTASTVNFPSMNFEKVKEAVEKPIKMVSRVFTKKKATAKKKK